MTTAETRDWRAEVLLRPLPRTVSPAPDETLSSYLGRLARANGMRHWEFDSNVRASRRLSDPFPPEAVITLGGQDPDSMRYAILELCTPGELATMKVAGRPRPRQSIPERRCALCAGTSDIHEDPVCCWRRHEDVLCLTHQRWTAAATQLDITGHEDIIQANKQHRRLIRRHGRPAVSRAFAQASSIIEEWALRPSYRDRFSQVMSSFPGDGPVFMHDPIALASCYVPAVALTRLLASPAWKALALDPDGSGAFVDEVRRTVEPSYRWNPYPYWRYVEPLARMLQDEADDGTLAMEAEASFWSRHRVRYPGPQPSEVIESGELCHDSRDGQLTTVSVILSHSRSEA